MTDSEAIEKLRAYHKCQRLQVKGIYEDCNEKLCDNCDLCYAQGNTGEHIKSIEIAIQALEKRIPKKPINKTRPDDYASLAYENCNIVVCPDCGRRLKLKSKGKYCDKCGQKLDWSGKE